MFYFYVFMYSFFLFKSSSEDIFIDFRERGWGRETETERKTSMREKSISSLPHMPQPMIQPATLDPRALTGDQVRKLLVPGTMLQPTEPPGRGHTGFIRDIRHF